MKMSGLLPLFTPVNRNGGDGNAADSGLAEQLQTMSGRDDGGEGKGGGASAASPRAARCRQGEARSAGEHDWSAAVIAISFKFFMKTQNTPNAQAIQQLESLAQCNPKSANRREHRMTSGALKRMPPDLRRILMAVHTGRIGCEIHPRDTQGIIDGDFEVKSSRHHKPHRGKNER